MWTAECYLLLQFFDFLFLLLGTLLIQLVLLLNHGISDGVLGIDRRVNIVRRRGAGGSTLFAEVSNRLMVCLRFARHYTLGNESTSSTVGARCSEDGSWTGSVIGEMNALFVEEVVKANQGQKKKKKHKPSSLIKIAIMQFRHVKISQTERPAPERLFRHSTAVRSWTGVRKRAQIGGYVQENGAVSATVSINGEMAVAHGNLDATSVFKGSFRCLFCSRQSQSVLLPSSPNITQRTHFLHPTKNHAAIKTRH